MRSKKNMFEEFLNNKNSWLNGLGPLSGIIFSSRIRLARNFNDYHFPGHVSGSRKEAILKNVEETYPAIKSLKGCAFVRMENLDDIDRRFLLERHLVSQEHIVSVKGKGLIVSGDERIAVMINEEDHLRMQVIASGFDVSVCWEMVNDIDDEFSRLFNIAFMPDFGYLTSCPTNTGTGLRASCMMHLPALVLTKRMNKILEFLSKISFTTRGLFGEGTQALGDFFQISNQVSLGLSEKEIVDNLTAVVNQVKDQELEARSVLMEKYQTSIEDNAWRALGILRNCRLISSKEALAHLSMLSLGMDLGIIKNINRGVLNSLFIVIQPAHMQKIEKLLLKEEERDRARAEILREKLKE